jgi:hypothetical protein
MLCAICLFVSLIDVDYIAILYYTYPAFVPHNNCRCYTSEIDLLLLHTINIVCNPPFLVLAQ